MKSLQLDYPTVAVAALLRISCPAQGGIEILLKCCRLLDCVRAQTRAGQISPQYRHYRGSAQCVVAAAVTPGWTADNHNQYRQPAQSPTLLSLLAEPNNMSSATESSDCVHVACVGGGAVWHLVEWNAAQV